MARSGKLRYMSPELLYGSDKTMYDAYKNDIYCLGQVLFAIATKIPMYDKPGDFYYTRVMNGHWLYDPMILNSDYGKTYRNLDKSLLGLISQMVKPECHRIGSIDEILKHPFFN
jgi:serine/threonine protein kinase